MEGSGAPTAVDEYLDDDDPGFNVIEVQEEVFEKTCKEIAEKYGFPARSIKPEPKDKSGKEKHNDSDTSKEDSMGNPKHTTEKDPAKKPKKSKSHKDGDSAIFDSKSKKAIDAEIQVKEEKKENKVETKKEEKQPENITKKLQDLIKKREGD